MGTTLAIQAIQTLDSIGENQQAFALTSPLYLKVAIDFSSFVCMPSVFASSGQIKATKLVTSTNEDSTALVRALGVNCYAFAIGRTPRSTQSPRDPIPGGVFVNKIREALISICTTQTPLPVHFPVLTTRPFLRKTFVSRLKEVFSLVNGVNAFTPGTVPDFSSCLQLILDDEEMAPYLTRFINAFYEVDSLEQLIGNDELLTDFYHLLTEEYRVPPEKMTPPIVSELLKLDGLIKIYPDSSQEESEGLDLQDLDFGTILIAAFCAQGDDYHFIRLFKDGWYERHGDTIQMRPNAPEGVPIGDYPDIQEVFYPGREKEFLGYFIVPTTVIVVDGIGRRFIFESHKT